MVFKVGHGEVKGNLSTRRGLLSWVLEIEKCCPMTCQWSFSPCAHVIMAFVDLQTRRFSKDIVTFTLRFLYSPRKGPLSWAPQVKLWELPALTSGPCDITAAPRCGSCPWRRTSQEPHASPGGWASWARAAAPGAWLERAEAGAAPAGGGHPGWRAVHAHCCSGGRPAPGGEQTTGLCRRATSVRFEVNIWDIGQGPLDSARSQRGGWGPGGGGGCGGCSARTPGPRDGPSEEEMHL